MIYGAGGKCVYYYANVRPGLQEEMKRERSLTYVLAVFKVQKSVEDWKQFSSTSKLEPEVMQIAEGKVTFCSKSLGKDD